MSDVRVVRMSRTGLGVIALAVFAAVACGAAGQKGNEGRGKGPMRPTTYDPQVSLAPLVEKVSPAVVNIKTTTKVKVPGFMGPDNLFEFFFGPRGRGQSPFGRSPEREQTRQAAGSGFIIDHEGLVVTNHHVVASADEIEVQLSDERVFKAELVGSDERTDVALLKLEDARKLPVVDFGDSDDLRVGDRVVAIGNPFGLDHTVTTGIVSAKERVIGAGPYDDFIQTDASINPGNSGGPLFNLRGQVIGINTAIVPHGQGIGFAIPSNLARNLIDSLRSSGKVVRGWLGIVPQPLDEKLANAFGLKDASGALVANVQPGSPAEEAGIEAGDVILRIGKKKLSKARDIYKIVAALKPGKSVNFEIVRNKERKKLKVRVGSRPDSEGGGEKKSDPKAKEPAVGKIGVQVEPLDDRMRARLGAHDLKSGVVVTAVSSGSKLKGDVKEGDIIVEVNREPVGTPSDFARATESLGAGDDMLLLVFRSGAWIYKVIRL